MAKRQPIVCQHLEKISRKVLEKYQSTITAYIKGRHGIYALYRKDKLYYVGLASNLRSRLKSHLHNKSERTWDRFSVYLTIQDGHIKELESLVLRIAQPQGNAQSGRFCRSENLLRRFRGNIKAMQANELNELTGKRTRSAKPKKKATRKTTSSTGRKPPLAKYIDEPFRIRSRFKGELVRARVRRDGTVLYRGYIYDSPSSAAAEACKRVSCNGWTFWKYERAPGDWVALRTLKK